MICDKCGVCCIVFDISTLNKPAGVPCPYLSENGLCSVYEERPAVCRAFKADEICESLAALPKGEKIKRLNAIYYD
ncbi:MAG: YkgJ family cysteine cluster protein [Deferribacteraceae bacterium]|jgi:Fe-S-cluster containining protein|nr:YkgJ family cysteine cluster protein [Deferribacteraceae bacterium]